MIEFLNTVYTTAETNEAKAARLLLDKIEKSFAANDMETVNEICAKLDFWKAGTIAAIGVVKSTSRCRDSLPNWTPMYWAAHGFLTSAGLDAKTIFLTLV